MGKSTFRTAAEIYSNDKDTIAVEMPELAEDGEPPVVVEFKTWLTVNERVELADAVGTANTVLGRDIMARFVLFEICALDDEGNRLVPPQKATADKHGNLKAKPNWFSGDVDSSLILLAVARAQLQGRVFGETDPLYRKLAKPTKDDSTRKKPLPT